MKSKSLKNENVEADTMKNNATVGSDWFDEQVEKYKNDPEFRVDALILKINEDLCRLMEEQQISRAELARRLGVHRQFITKLLNGMPNLTLLTLVKVATALNYHVNFHLVPDIAKQAFTTCEAIVDSINDIGSDWEEAPPPLHIVEGGRRDFANAA